LREKETVEFSQALEWSQGRSGEMLASSDLAQGERAMTLHLDLLTAECGNIFVAGEVALPKDLPATERCVASQPKQADPPPVTEAPAGVWGY
jgi:hypothetical protein